MALDLRDMEMCAAVQNSDFTENVSPWDLLTLLSKRSHHSLALQCSNFADTSTSDVFIIGISKCYRKVNIIEMEPYKQLSLAISEGWKNEWCGAVRIIVYPSVSGPDNT